MVVFTILIPLIGLAGCGTSRHAAPGGKQDIERVWHDLGIAEKYHAGLAVFDPSAGKWLFQYRSDNVFTPASNVKILTLKAALDILPDTLAAGWYRRSGDSLIIWGGGDPGTWYPDYRATNPLLDFMRSRPERLFIGTGHFRTTRYGAGWAWDDFAYTFQPERTSMPIHGNLLWVERYKETIRVAPSSLAGLVEVRQGDRTAAGRSESGDRFWYSYDPGKLADTVAIPLAFWGNDMVRLWSHYAGKTILPVDAPLPQEGQVISGAVRDSLLKIMMRESDNFIAEQLLLASAVYASGVMDERRLIDSMLRKPLAPVAREITWVDGSGLSRYNLASPRALVWALARILEDRGIDYVRQVFPAGGRSGTLAKWYVGERGEPYVFAKTGTLANHHNLSGYLITRKGKILIFSWMNNLFEGSSTPVKKDMEKLLSALYAAY